MPRGVPKAKQEKRWDWYTNFPMANSSIRSSLKMPMLEHDCLNMYTDFGVLLDTYCY